MSVTRDAYKVNLCNCAANLAWHCAQRSYEAMSTETAEYIPPSCSRGRPASRFIVHSSFLNFFDEVLKFGQKGQVQFITPNCSGCVALSAICQMS